MIRTFKHKGLRRFFVSGDQRGIPVQFAAKLERMLDRLDAVTGPGDMDLPGYGFHALKGQRKGTYAVRVSGNWRLTFRFKDGNAENVDLEDYH